MDYSFVTQGLKWGDPGYGNPGGTINWSLWSRNFGGEAFNFTASLTSQMAAEIERAMSAWEAVARIDFVSTSDNGTLNTTGLRIGLGPIDGENGTLALARRYTPASNARTEAAQISIDTAEGWRLSNGQVISADGDSFYQIVLHELGHVLGLAHYDGAPAIMNTAASNLRELQPGDIAGARAIYGAASNAQLVDFTAKVRDVEIDMREGQTETLPGSLILLHYSLMNSGGPKSVAGRVGFYLSSDTGIDLSDRDLGYLDLSDVIASPGQLDVATYVRLPNDLPAGRYYVGIRADAANALAEANETNNFSNGFAFTVGGGVVTPGMSTIPAAIVASFINGSGPSPEKLDALSQFAIGQYKAYKASGVARPELGPYEALGRGFAETSAFSAKYNGLAATDFVKKAYLDIFERSATDAQLGHFSAQLSYFEMLYTKAGIGSDSAKALSKGAIAGQMLGFAALDEASQHSYIKTIVANLPSAAMAANSIDWDFV